MIHGAFAPVRTTFWTDPDVRTTLTPEAKLMLLYYISSPHSNMIGLYSCPLDYVARETGLSRADVRFHTQISLKPFVTYDEKTEEVFVHGAARHRLGSDSLKDHDKRRGSITRLFNACHSPYLRWLFADEYADWKVGTAKVPEGYNPLVAPITATTQVATGRGIEAPSEGHPASAEGTEEVEVDGNGEVDVDGDEPISGASPPPAVPIRPDAADWMHAAWQEVLGSGRVLGLTPTRRAKYRAMYREQLEGTEDPMLAWRAVLWAVTKSEHHMSNRDYQLPESLLRSPERREKWVEKAMHTASTNENRERQVADMAEFIRRRRGA